MPFLASVLALWLLGTPPSGPEAHVERRLHVMGTVLQLTVDAPGAGAAARAAEAAVATLERYDRLLTTWDPAGPMGRLNAAAVIEPVAADPELLGLLAEAEAWAVRTGRAFDPTVGALVDVWDLRGEGRVATAPEIAAALARTGPAAFRVDPTMGIVTRLLNGAWIDTGAFGKGAALRAAADTLRARGARRALLDLGGQVLALAAPGEEPWEVGVAHPVRRGETAANLRLAGVSAATSGNSERGFEVDGLRVGHVLDPLTGAPSPWWGSVTVVSADPLEADVLSTALYVMGPEAGLAWARDLPDVGVLFLVEGDGGIQTLRNQAMKRWLITAPASAGGNDLSFLERRIP